MGAPPNAAAAAVEPASAEREHYHEGPAPPPGGQSGDWIEIPHEHFIPVSKARLVRALEQMPFARASDGAVPVLLRQLDTAYHLAFKGTLDVLKQDYEYFAPEVGESIREGVSAEELLDRQRTFLATFLETMVRGNFNPLSEREYTRALAQSYVFDLPVDIRWTALDERMLPDLYTWLDDGAQAVVRERLGLNQPSASSLGLAESFRDRVLVFHRGIEPDHTAGWFGLETLDILLSRALQLILLPLRLLAWIFVSRSASSHTAEPPADALWNAESTVFTRRWLRRVNLHNQSLLRGLFDVSSLQEPALQRVICLFRLRPEPAPGWIARLPVVRRFVNAGRSPRSADDVDRTIHIKLFKHIPLADLEMIFPDSRIRMKPFDRAMLVLTALGGCWAAWRAFESTHRSAAFVVLGVLAAYMIKLVVGYIRARNNYAAQMARDLYHKNLDNNVGVLQSLTDTLQGQEFKEAALVYCILRQEGAALTAVQLDGRVESFVQREFPGVQVDFEIQDALRKLVEPEGGGGDARSGSIPLIRSQRGDDGTLRYEAVDVDTAQAVVRRCQLAWLDEKGVAVARLAS